MPRFGFVLAGAPQILWGLGHHHGGAFKGERATTQFAVGKALKFGIVNQGLRRHAAHDQQDLGLEQFDLCAQVAQTREVLVSFNMDSGVGAFDHVGDHDVLGCCGGGVGSPRRVGSADRNTCTEWGFGMPRGGTQELFKQGETEC